MEYGPQLQLCLAFARELADRYRAAVDVCVHQPRTGADHRNHHAHLLMSTREVTPDGLGARTRLEVSGRERHLKGISGSSRDEYLAIRARWGELTNQALERAGLSLRIDHRSLKAQGIDREPLTIPEKVWYAERSGRFSEAGNEIRARHRERLEARKLGTQALTRVIEKQRDELKSRLELEKAGGQAKKTPFGSLTREERNAYRREYYRKRREREANNPSAAEARRAAGRRSYHLQMQKNPEAIRKARGRYRAENAEEMNRKQREYRRKNADSLNQKRREQRKARSIEFQRSTDARAASVRGDGPKAAATRWNDYRAKQGPVGSAAESAQRWKKFRLEQKAREAALGSHQRTYQRDDADSDFPDRTRPRRRSHDLER